MQTQCHRLRLIYLRLGTKARLSQRRQAHFLFCSAPYCPAWPPEAPKRPSEHLSSAPNISRKASENRGRLSARSKHAGPAQVLLQGRTQTSTVALKRNRRLAIIPKLPSIYGTISVKQHTKVGPWEVPSFYFLTNPNQSHRFFNNGSAEFLC